MGVEKQGGWPLHCRLMSTKIPASPRFEGIVRNPALAETLGTGKALVVSLKSPLKCGDRGQRLITSARFLYQPESSPAETLDFVHSLRSHDPIEFYLKNDSSVESIARGYALIEKLVFNEPGAPIPFLPASLLKLPGKQRLLVA